MLSALVALVLLGAPASALAAAQTNAPPGNSAIDEYLETVPSATGNSAPKPPSAAGAKGTTANGSTLTAAQRTQLERLGADGRALADVVDRTSPRAPDTSATKHAVPLPDGKGRSPLSEAIDAATGRDGGGGGMGTLLPAILLATLFGFVVLAVLRRRSAS